MKLFTILLVLFPVFFTRAQISPGDLTKAHAGLEGISNCTKCHVLGEKVNNSKCLDCHTEIKNLINMNRGFHSSNDVKGKECRVCHSEHNGRNFRIINFNRDSFDHNKTTFALTGKHNQLQCTNCHKREFIPDPEIKKRKNTFLGLKNECRSCHNDYHQGTLGNNCENCHDTNVFRPASKFNHSNSVFKLTGAHAAAACISCHPKEQKQGKEYQKFKGLQYSSCSNCHTDIHKGKFGSACNNCHVVSSFKNINAQAFDHNKAGYPLKGKHASVSCSSCHKGNYTEKLNYEFCTDCHKDYHNGEFTNNNKVKDCSGCHTVDGFRPSLYTVEQHNQTAFKLNGAHLAVPCEGCHKQKEKWIFRLAGSNCISCHTNVHRDEITEEFMPGDDCTRCHETGRWSAVSFNHSTTSMPLEGKHRDVSCSNCHYRDKKQFLFVSLSGECITCHRDVHAGQFNNSCINCHNFNNWIPVKFNHSNTNFPLEGAHQKLSCSACHKKEELNGAEYIKYKLKDFKCAACHS